jgi:hypothetical protein
MRGRPRSFEKQSETFLRLYLDPLKSPADISQACAISLATYYNYEKELNLPQLRVGIENQNAHLPRLKALRSFKSACELYELRVLCDLAAYLKVRIKMIPCLATDAHAAVNAVKAKSVDFALAGISWTRERAQQVHFSDPYKPDISPCGVLMRAKKEINVRRLKPRLGVHEGSVHKDHAMAHLQNDFDIRVFKNVQPTLQALIQGHVDYVLLHTDWLEDFPQEAQAIEVCSEPFYYQSFTGIIFHSDSELWRQPVNEAIARMLEERYRISRR